MLSGEGETVALRDLLVKFGVDVEGVEKLEITDEKLTVITKKAKEAGGAFDSFGGMVKKAIGTYLGFAAVRALKNFAEGLVQQADQLKHNAERLGLSTDELQKYQYVSDQMQVPVQQTAVALRFFNRAVGEAALGTKSAVKVFSQLGVAVKDANGNVRPTDELLFEVADKLKNTNSQAVRTAYAMRLLGRGGSALLPVLQNGSAELRKMFKDVEELGGGFNENFVGIAHQTDVALKRLRMGWRSVYVAILTEVLPVFNKWIEGSIRNVKVLIDYAKHTYGIRTALMALAAGGVIAALTKLFSLFKIGKLGLKDILTLFVKYPLVAAFAAAVTLLYLAFDDLYTFLKGGDSVLGRFLDSIGGMGTALEVWRDLKQALLDVWEALKPAEGALKGVAKEMISAFVDSIPYIIKWGGVITMWVIDKLDAAITFMRQIGPAVSAAWANFKGKDTSKEDAEVLRLEEGYKARQAQYEEAAAAFRSITDPELRASRNFARTSPGGPDFAGPLQDPNAGGGAPVTVNVTNNITTTADPQATAKAAGDSTKRAVKDVVVRKRDAFNAVSAGQPVTGQ